MVFKKLRSYALAAGIGLASLLGANTTKADWVSENAPPHIQTLMNKDLEARLGVLGTNVVFGCLKSGVGAYVNDQNPLEGCAKGALAGAIIYAGEEIASYNKYPMMGAVGKLVLDLGVSMSDNVMRGKDMFSEYQTDIGPVTMIFKRGKLAPEVKFTVTPMLGIARSIFLGDELDFEQSLFNLTLIFKMGANSNIDTGAYIAEGLTVGNVVVYNSNLGKNQRNLVLSHEMNHSLFWSKLRFTSDLLNLIPTEKVPLAPKMEDIQKVWNIGQDASSALLYLPNTLSSDAAWYILPELEAYSVERQ